MAKKAARNVVLNGEKIHQEDGELLGTRIPLLKEMLQGLTPDVIQSRMLAGSDDKVKGIEAHVLDWAKNGLTTLGSARGSRLLADTVLEKFRRNNELLKEHKLLHDEHMHQYAQELKEIARQMPKYGGSQAIKDGSSN